MKLVNASDLGICIGMNRISAQIRDAKSKALRSPFVTAVFENFPLIAL